MKSFTCFLLSGLALTGALAAPVSEASNPLPKRADVCGQWDSQTTGRYIMYNNLWGRDSATSGSQCSGVDSISGNTVKWHTSWTWAGGPYNVKSYSQIYDNVSTAKQVSAIKSYPSTWSWSYSGSSLIANVAYDIFTYSSSAANGSPTYEVMIWLAALGGAGPISATGQPIATPSVAGKSWRLYYGLNGSMKVYSFVATSNVSNFSGDLKEFFNYLARSQGFPTSQWMKGAAGGTEPFTGSNGRMTATFSAVRN